MNYQDNNFMSTYSLLIIILYLDQLNFNKYSSCLQEVTNYPSTADLTFEWD